MDDRFAARDISTAKDGSCWIIYDVVTGDELFGDQLPNSKAEADKCVRSANRAVALSIRHFKIDLKQATDKLGESYGCPSYR